MSCWKLLFLISGMALCGCTSSEPVGDPTVVVTGTVTLDGQPLPTGRILFIEDDREPRREYLAEIHEGSFRAEAPPGTRRVEIRSWQQPANPSLEDAPYPQIVPARYNDDSELTAELKPSETGEPQVLTFDLKSDGK